MKVGVQCKGCSGCRVRRSIHGSPGGERVEVVVYMEG